MSILNSMKAQHSVASRDTAIAQLTRSIEQSKQYFKAASIEFSNGTVIAHLGDQVYRLSEGGYELNADLEAVARLSERRVL